MEENKLTKASIIESFYSMALDFLVKGDRKAAENILYDLMPKEFYDLSLDILDNRNEKVSNQELRALISRVDKILNPKLIEDEEV